MLKQFSKSVLCLLIVAWTFCAASSSAFAQLQPAISPWMGMFDQSRSPGSLPNYLRNVKPQQDLMKAYNAQQNQLQMQQQALQAMQSGGISGGSGGGGSIGPRDLLGGDGSLGADKNTILLPPKEIPSMQQNPAGFNQYLHYYPANSLPRRPVPNYSSVGGRR